MFCLGKYINHSSKLAWLFPIQYFFDFPYHLREHHLFIQLQMKIPDRINIKKIVQKMNLGAYCLKIANWPDEVHFEDGRNVYSSPFGFPGLVILSLISLS
jgi:hypothetical protein